jgi:hypothetical protein
MEYVIEDTKTSSGTRDVPMMPEVAEDYASCLPPYIL